MIPLLVAHRGYMERYPENSLSAITAALASGACMVEFDVQMNADQEIIVLHDDSFERTGDSPGSVFDPQDYSGISIHEPGRLGQDFYPESVPTLKRVIELIARYPAATAFVEIKDESIHHWGLEKVVDAVLSRVASARQQCVIIADNLDALLYARSSAAARIGWVIHRYDNAHSKLARRHAPEFMICNYRRISGDLWQGDWQWMLYDISDPELALDWAKRGSALIETRDIGAMLQHPLLQQRACRQARA